MPLKIHFILSIGGRVMFVKTTYKIHKLWSKVQYRYIGGLSVYPQTLANTQQLSRNHPEPNKLDLSTNQLFFYYFKCINASLVCKSDPSDISMCIHSMYSKIWLKCHFLLTSPVLSMCVVYFLVVCMSVCAVGVWMTPNIRSDTGSVWRVNDLSRLPLHTQTRQCRGGIFFCLILRAPKSCAKAFSSHRSRCSAERRKKQLVDKLNTFSLVHSLAVSQVMKCERSWPLMMSWVWKFYEGKCARLSRDFTENTR